MLTSGATPLPASGHFCSVHRWFPHLGKRVEWMQEEARLLLSQWRNAPFQGEVGGPVHAASWKGSFHVYKK